MLKRILFLQLGKHFEANITFSATSLVICLGAAVKKSVTWVRLKSAVRCAALMGKITMSYNFDGADHHPDIVLATARIALHPTQARNVAYARALSTRLRTVPTEVSAIILKKPSHPANLRQEKRTCRNCILTSLFHFFFS